MAFDAHSTPAPGGSVVPFPGTSPVNADRLSEQRWPRTGLTANVVPIRQHREPLRLADTPERAFIRAIGRHLTPKAYAGVLSLLGQQAEAGDLYSKAALLLVMDRA